MSAPENRGKSGGKPPEAYRFKKGGPSPNPGGRPKKILTAAYLRKLTEGEADAIAQALIRSAKKGNVKAIQELADRLEGKAATAAEDREALQASADRADVDSVLSDFLCRGIHAFLRGGGTLDKLPKYEEDDE